MFLFIFPFLAFTDYEDVIKTNWPHDRIYDWPRMFSPGRSVPVSYKYFKYEKVRKIRWGKENFKHSPKNIKPSMGIYVGGVKDPYQ